MTPTPTANAYEQARDILTNTAELIQARGLNPDVCPSGPDCLGDEPICLFCAIHRVKLAMQPQPEAEAEHIVLATVQGGAEIDGTDTIVAWLQEQASRTTNTSSNPMAVRDGIPTVYEMLKAARLLQIPVDTEDIGLERMTYPRQQTALLALLMTWLATFGAMHEGTADAIDTEEMGMLFQASSDSVSGHDPAHAMTTAAWQLSAAGFALLGLGQPGPGDPTTALGAMIRALIHTVTAWRLSCEDDEHRPEVAADPIANARKQLQAAMDALDSLGEIQPPPGADAAARHMSVDLTGILGEAGSVLQVAMQIPEVRDHMADVLEDRRDPQHAAAHAGLQRTWAAAEPGARAALLLMLAWAARAAAPMTADVANTAHGYAAELHRHATEAASSEAFHGPGFPGQPFPGAAGIVATGLGFDREDLDQSLLTALILLRAAMDNPAPAQN